jgi:hypothetical protein
MEKTYLSISITYYNSTKVYIEPDVHYYRNDGVHPVTSTWNKLTVDEANQLMWELVKLGGKNIIKSNRYRPSICTREVTFWGRL